MMEKREQVLLKTGGLCAYCGTDLRTSRGKWHIDHMVPKAQGGTNDISNLVPACQKCNTQKNNKTVKEYRQWIAERHRQAAYDRANFLDPYLDRESIAVVDEALRQYLEALDKIVPRIKFYMDDRRNP